MLQRESLKNNSIGPNVLTDDPTAINYMALAYCIAGVKTDKGRKYLGIPTSCRVFNLYDKTTDASMHGKVKHIKKVEERKKTDTQWRGKTSIVVTDLITKKETRYENTYIAAKALGMKSNSVSMYMKKGHIYKARYLITMEGDISKARKNQYGGIKRRAKAMNIHTGEQKEFDSLTEVATYIDVSRMHVTKLAKYGHTTKSGWKVEYID